MKWIAMIGVLIIVCLGLAAIYGSYRWQSNTDNLRAKLINGQRTITALTAAMRYIFKAESYARRGTRRKTVLLNSGKRCKPQIYEQKEIEGLPDPVQRFFRTVLKDGQAIVAVVKLSQQGQFNLNETEAKWNPFTATQLVMTQRLGFDWDARIQMAPGVNAFVHDTYLLGEGNLHASLLGLFTVAKTHSTPEANQGELLRFFAEATWYPTALLPSQGVRWEAIDDTSSRYFDGMAQQLFP
ncbi:DUF6920 family protein [Nostoc sp.]|uniref:DUF6920 family protein n=1 Tax=Nostoc sp. TaxID=1180 RepID=UPI002FFAB689